MEQHILCYKCNLLLVRFKSGTSEKDFKCPACGEIFQVKNSKLDFNKKGISMKKKIPGGNYQTTIDPINNNTHSNYILIGRELDKNILIIEFIAKENISINCIGARKQSCIKKSGRIIHHCDFLRDVAPNKIQCWL